jgi:hypothetical protein
LKPDLRETDRVRLDVGVAGINEMFSWVGENRFDDNDLFDLVGQGALQVDDFSGFLTTIFGGEDADFSYDGETQVNGRMLAKFGFQVPEEKSRYVFSNRKLARETVTGYEGYVLADPGTGDLVRLVIRTNSNISETGSCESDTTLDYIRVRLNDSEFLLPRESELRFDVPVPEASTRATQTSGPPAIPAKLPFKLVFTQAIDAKAAAAGDRIKAKLASPIRDASSKQILVPAGADVIARITEFSVGAQRGISMLVMLESVMVQGEEAAHCHHSPARQSEDRRVRIPQSPRRLRDPGRAEVGLGDGSAVATSLPAAQTRTARCRMTDSGFRAPAPSAPYEDCRRPIHW